MDTIRSIDLSSGRPVPVKAQGKAGEILLFAAVDPSSPAFADGAVTTAEAVIDVWGADRRLALVEQHFFVHAQWFRAWLGNDPLPAGVLDTPGEGLTVTCTATVIVRDHDGAIHELGDLASAYWLNGGSAPDGIEMVSGMDGVRLTYHLSAGVLPSNAPSWWNLVVKLEAKPNTRIGCGAVVDEIEQTLQINLPRKPVAYHATSGGV